MPSIRPISLAVLCLCSQQALIAQTRGGDPVLEAVTVEARVSAHGLSIRAFETNHPKDCFDATD